MRRLLGEKGLGDSESHNNKFCGRPHNDQHRLRVQETKFNRYILHDIASYRRDLAAGAPGLYSPAELGALEKAGVSKRLPPRATAYYIDLARRSRALSHLIKARAEETDDPSGETDSCNQLKYSPIPGLLHKYEMVVLYASTTCSSWCRYCYRADLLTGKNEKRIASLPDVIGYIKAHNARVEAGETDKPLIREALLSGGDPMILSNRNLFDYFIQLSEIGLERIRIGTKELAFFPERFDKNFFQMLDLFHDLHPNVQLAFMTHFTHPDEFLHLADNGEYIHDAQGYPLHNMKVAVAVEQLASRAYVTLENQTPIISKVNDDADSLRLLHRELKCMGVNNRYTFQCRAIEGHRAFALPIEQAWDIYRESQIGLSGVERSCFVLPTEAGKLELVAVIGGIKEAAWLGPLGEVLMQGLTIFRLHRTPNSALQGNIIIARSNPEALWISDYEDRLLYDGRCHDPAKSAAPLLELLATQAQNDAPEALSSLAEFPQLNGGFQQTL